MRSVKLVLPIVLPSRNDLEGLHFSKHRVIKALIHQLILLYTVYDAEESMFLIPARKLPLMESLKQEYLSMMVQIKSRRVASLKKSAKKNRR